jgi:hypothetical protein
MKRWIAIAVLALAFVGCKAQDADAGCRSRGDRCGAVRATVRGAGRAIAAPVRFLGNRREARQSRRACR